MTDLFNGWPEDGEPVRHEILLDYLKAHANKERDMLCVVAAYTGLPEFQLHKIVDGTAGINDDLARTLYRHIDKSILQELQQHLDSGALDITADMTGIAGGVDTLYDLCHAGENTVLDDTTRKQLLELVI